MGFTKALFFLNETTKAWRITSASNITHKNIRCNIKMRVSHNDITLQYYDLRQEKLAQETGVTLKISNGLILYGSS